MYDLLQQYPVALVSDERIGLIFMGRSEPQRIEAFEIPVLSTLRNSRFEISKAPETAQVSPMYGARSTCSQRAKASMVEESRNSTSVYLYQRVSCNAIISHELFRADGQRSCPSTFARQCLLTSCASCSRSRMDSDVIVRGPRACGACAW